MDLERIEDMLDAGTPLITFNVKTTGLSPDTDRILSICAVKCIRKNGFYEEIGKMDLKINPLIAIPEISESLSGVTEKEKENYKTEAQVIDTIIDFFGERPFLAGYNPKRTDIEFMNAMYMRVAKKEFNPYIYVDVHEFAKKIMNIENNGLKTLAHTLGVDPGLSYSIQMDEVVATFRIFSHLMKKYEEIPHKSLVRVKVNSANLWKGPSYKLKRIYINTTPVITAYYDIVKKRWICENPDVDKDQLVEDVLFLYNTGNINDFVRIIEKQAST